MTEQLAEDLDLSITERAGTVAIIACDETGDAVGWAWLDLQAAPGADNVGVHVLASRRGYGFGFQLLEALMAEARRRGVHFLRTTHPDDVAARKLLRRSTGIASRRVFQGQSKDVVVVPAA